jgi:gliding motility-associated-like protein
MKISISELHNTNLFSRWSTAYCLLLTAYFLFPFQTTAQSITKAEYFFDTDPGNGNGIPIAIIPSGTVSFTTSIPTSSLSQGFHFLGIRVKETGGVWSIFESRGFYITASTSNVTNIAAAEYFIDADPGNGNGTAIPTTSGTNVNFVLSVPTTSLSSGFHFLAIRTKDLSGKWGVFEARGFYITTSTTNVPNITSAEYFFDADPGNGNGISIPITSGATSNFTATIPVTGLTPGFHFLAIRTKDGDGKWGIFESRGFYVSPTSANSADIVAAEYFIDTDPGEDNGIAAIVSPTGPTINQIFSLAINSTPSGAHQLGFRVKDAKGVWSEVQREPFTVLSCTSPPPPTAPNVNRCNSGTMTLTATAGATGAQVYNWYADATSTAVLFTGASFTIPTLLATTNFFVNVFDPNTLCESKRTSVTATVTSTTKPSLNASGTISLCQGATFLLSAPAGFSNYTWSNGAITQQIAISGNGGFSVIVASGSCVSVPSDVVTFSFTGPCNGGGPIIDPNNSPPVISSIKTNTVIGGKVTLSLSGLITDADNNLDLTTLRIVRQPASGAVATLSAQELSVDYKNIDFSGQEELTLQVCDKNGICTQQQVFIEVNGDVTVYNAISPNGDDLNSVLILKDIEILSPKNQVSIYNRWGDEVFSISDYDNKANVFMGFSNDGNKLPTGTYFYKITLPSTGKAMTGFLQLKY